MKIINDKYVEFKLIQKYRIPSLLIYLSHSPLFSNNANFKSWFYKKFRNLIK